MWSFEERVSEMSLWKVNRSRDFVKSARLSAAHHTPPAQGRVFPPHLRAKRQACYFRAGALVLYKVVCVRREWASRAESEHDRAALSFQREWRRLLVSDWSEGPLEICWGSWFLAGHRSSGRRKGQRGLSTAAPGTGTDTVWRSHDSSVDFGPFAEEDWAVWVKGLG